MHTPAAGCLVYRCRPYPRPPSPVAPGVAAQQVPSTKYQRFKVEFLRRKAANHNMSASRLVRNILRSWGSQRSFSSSASALEKLIIFDTTLRDGEQSPGCTLQLREKVAIAHQLARLGVDVCEAGFPVASPGDFEAVRTIARDVGPVVSDGRTIPMTICGLARATEKDIDRCFDAVRHAPRHRVHTFLATSDIHVREKPL